MFSLTSRSGPEPKIKLGALPPDATAFFMCDLQSKFKMHVKYFAEVIANSKKLVDAGKIMEIPLIVTEQYPQGLGSTVDELDIGHARGVFPKTRFTMLVEEVEKKIGNLCKKKMECVVLFGVEAHVCIEQTAIDLMAKGYAVHIVADCTSSRSQEDRLLAFQRLSSSGAFITTMETVIFKLLGDKEHPDFKAIQAIIKAKTESTGLVPSTLVA